MGIKWRRNAGKCMNENWVENGQKLDENFKNVQKNWSKIKKYFWKLGKNFAQNMKKSWKIIEN